MIFDPIQIFGHELDRKFKSAQISVVGPNVANNRIAIDREAGYCNSG